MEESYGTPYPSPLENGVKVLENIQEEGKRVDKGHLINKLNFINFQDGVILINFVHPRFKHSCSRPAKPQACFGEYLECLWLEDNTAEPQQDLSAFQVRNFLVIDGKKALVVVPQETTIHSQGISFMLPETCREINSRRLYRHRCEGITAQLIQNGTIFQGALLDFSAVAFRVELFISPPQTFNWLNPDLPVTLLLAGSGETLYSSECMVIRHTREQHKRTYVLDVSKEQVQRFRPKRFRSHRYQLFPSPNLCFCHPLSGKSVTLKVINVSGSGFAVEESEHLSVMGPGMMIPRAELSFANSLKIPCRAQVVYRRVHGEKHGKSMVRVGVAILDMNIRDHGKLLGILHQTDDENTYVNNEVDLDSLWNFFFETGFIYPQKYAHLQTRKEQLRETYRKIYNESPDIACHFTYQEEGRILGHVATLRFYNNSWMIHHHAARKADHMRAGLMALNQIGQFVNDSLNLYSFHMNYLFCFFRPENRFPQRVFGGAAKGINDPGGCSLDSFAYFHFYKHAGGALELPAPWSLEETSTSDLLALKGFYDFESGGLMLQAFDLEPEMIDLSGLSREYERIGLTRRRFLFSLKKHARLQAVIVLNLSDIGLNLSDLTSCIKVLLVDPAYVPRQIVHLILSILSSKFAEEEIPILLFPRSYMEEHGMASEKTYNLWVLNTQYSDAYFDHVQKLIDMASQLERGRK